jgi:hypothetical protein
MKKSAIQAIAIALMVPALFAQDQPAPKIDVSKLPKEARAVDEVIVPVPSEIFGVLDKLGRPKWRDVQRPLKTVAKPFPERPQTALYLGTVIAEGFIAVEAGDAAEVKIIGNSVLGLSDALGVRKAVTKRANAIIGAADDGNWPAVRTELDGALNEVKIALNELKSTDLANLVALGGWMRGTEALCDVVSADYSKDGADLLHQPLLLTHFKRSLDELKGRLKKDPLVGKAQKTLKNIEPLIGQNEGADISAKTVKEIGSAAASLVKDIQTKKQ